MEFKSGDTVQLKSDGPIMTVESVKKVRDAEGQQRDSVSCIWFDGSIFKHNAFYPAMLNHVKKSVEMSNDMSQ